MYERSAWNASKFSKSIFFAKFPQLASDFFDLGFSIRRDPGNVSLHHVVVGFVDNFVASVSDSFTSPSMISV